MNGNQPINIDKELVHLSEWLDRVVSAYDIYAELGVSEQEVYAEAALGALEFAMETTAEVMEEGAPSVATLADMGRQLEEAANLAQEGAQTLPEPGARSRREECLAMLLLSVETVPREAVECFKRLDSGAVAE